MKSLIIITGLFVIAILNTGCPKSCIEANYAFEATIQLFPDDSIIHIGDTLWLNCSFPTRLKNISTGELIDYSNATDIESTLSIAKLINGNMIPQGSVYNFNYVSEIGQIYNATNIPSPQTVQQLRFQQVGTNYQIKIGIIARDTGVFALGIGDGLSNSRNHSKKCEKASFQFTISETSQHINYYQAWRPGYTLSPSDISKLYCFWSQPSLRYGTRRW